MVNLLQSNIHIHETYLHLDIYVFGHLADTFGPKRLILIHTLIVEAAMQVANQAYQEQLGVQYLAQGHFNMQTRGIEPATFLWQEAGSTTEPQPQNFNDNMQK